MGSPATPTRASEASDDRTRARDEFGLERHGERRRRQLVEVAAHLIETEGPDAVRMARVAELAGCTRPLVYRYFPQREDLLAAVVSQFYEHLNALMSVEEHAQGLVALTDPDPDAAWAGARRLMEGAWDVTEQLGMGGLVLARSEIARSLAQRERADAESSETERRWFRPLRACGLSDVGCALALDCATSVTYSLMTQHRAGAITREEGVRLGFVSLRSLIRGLQAADAGRETPAT